MLLNSLATQRINAITEEILEEQDDDARRVFDNRIDQVPAEDGDVMASIKGNVVAADIIQVDQEAVIHQAEEVRLTTTAIPKLKHGRALSESMIILLRRIARGSANGRETVSFDNYVARHLRSLLKGIRDRRELLYSAMLRDAFVYNRLGIQANATWGMPANLKVALTGTQLFSAPSTATPVSTIQAYLNSAKTVNSENFDRLTMRSSLFDLIVQTTEFNAKAVNYAPFVFPTGVSTVSNTDRGRMTQLMSAMFNGATIELYDDKTNIEVGSGALTNEFFLPTGDIIFTDSRDDNNPEAYDFANAVVIETLPGVVPLIIGGDFNDEQDGPVSYATAANPQGNPPGEVLWAVQRGFPRKHRASASGVITCL